MAKLALALSLISLAISILAYQAAGGNRTLTAHLRAAENAVAVARQETADTFARLARALRGGPQEGPPRDAPADSKR